MYVCACAHTHTTSPIIIALLMLNCVCTSLVSTCGHAALIPIKSMQPGMKARRRASQEFMWVPLTASPPPPTQTPTTAKQQCEGGWWFLRLLTHWLLSGIGNAALLWAVLFGRHITTSSRRLPLYANVSNA